MKIEMCKSIMSTLGFLPDSMQVNGIDPNIMVRRTDHGILSNDTVAIGSELWRGGDSSISMWYKDTDHAS